MASIPDDELLTLHLDLQDIMDKAAEKFAPGVMITLVAHFPGKPSKGLFLSNDVDGAIEQIRYLREGGATKVIEPMRGS